MPAVEEVLHDIALEAIEAAAFKGALSKASTAVTVVATDGPFGRAGLTCSAVSSVCDNPPTMLLCVNRKSFAADIIRGNRVISINWLSASQSPISQVFAGVGSVPMEDRFSDDGWGVMVTGAPCRMDAPISFDCQITNIVDVGSHSVLFARVVAENNCEECNPLIYHQRQYMTTTPLIVHGN